VDCEHRQVVLLALLERFGLVIGERL